MDRPTWDEWALALARAASTRADCKRSKVGAVIMDDDHHIVDDPGYNGSWPGGPSCLAGECPRAQSNVDPGSSYDTGPGSCIALHAEQNAIIRAGKKSAGCTLYVTRQPCDGCWKLIKGAKIKRVVWPEGEVSLP